MESDPNEILDALDQVNEPDIENVFAHLSRKPRERKTDPRELAELGFPPVERG